MDNTENGSPSAFGEPNSANIDDDRSQAKAPVRDQPSTNGREPHWLERRFAGAFREVLEKQYPQLYGDAGGPNGSPAQQATVSTPVGTPATSDDPRSREYVNTAYRALLSEMEATQPGNRNTTLNGIAYRLGRFVGGGYLTEDDVTDQLAKAARVTGLGDAEISTTLGSGLRSGKLDPLTIRLRPEEQVPEASAMDDERIVALVEFWDQRDQLRQIYDFALSRRVSPWAVLGVVLARVIASIPLNVVLPPLVGSVASLNLFVGLVGPSGFGKGGAIGAAKDAFTMSDGFERFKVHPLGTGHGIAHAYAYRDPKTKELVYLSPCSALFIVDEIDLLKAHSNLAGSTVLPELRRMFMGEQLGALYADQSKRIEIEEHTYRAALVAGIQPARSDVLLKDADGGTPQRFLWLPTIFCHPDNRRPEPQPMPWDIPAKFRGMASGRVEVEVCQTAKDEIDASQLARARGMGDPLDGHRLLLKEKVAAALAFLSGYTAITESEWRLADIVMHYSDRSRRECQDALKVKDLQANTARAQKEAQRAITVNTRVADDTVKRVCRSILRHLNRTDEWVPRNSLRHRLNSRDRGYFEEAISGLGETGQVEERITDTGAEYKRVRNP